MADQQIHTDALTGGVLEPVTLADFFTHSWEQQPLHIARSSVNPFDQLISIAAIEGLLSTNELFFPTVQLTQAGKAISTAEYIDENNRIISNRVAEQYRCGSTIVLTHAHKFIGNLMRLCRLMQKSFLMRCQTNVYLSPAGNQGFNPHFDTHDVFILQVSGSKTFNFYSGGISFPTSADRFNSETHKVGEKTESIELNAGDTLYIPRGCIHDAVASIDEPSLHVTLGVYPVLMHELLQEITHSAVAADVVMRKAVPQSLWTSTGRSKSTITQISNIMQNAMREETVRQALSRLLNDMALDATPDAHQSLQCGPHQPLDVDSNVFINHQSILHSEQIGNLFVLRTFGALVEFNVPYSGPVEWLLNQSKLTLRDIPDLNDNQRIAVGERLREYGVVSVC